MKNPGGVFPGLVARVIGAPASRTSSPCVASCPAHPDSEIPGKMADGTPPGYRADCTGTAIHHQEVRIQIEARPKKEQPVDPNPQAASSSKPVHVVTGRPESPLASVRNAVPRVDQDVWFPIGQPRTRIAHANTDGHKPTHSTSPEHPQPSGMRFAHLHRVGFSIL